MWKVTLPEMVESPLSNIQCLAAQTEETQQQISAELPKTEIKPCL